MPLFATWIGNLLGSFAGFFAQWFTKRVAILITIVTALLAMTAAFVAAINSLIAGIALVTPPELGYALSWFVPDNITVCLGAYSAARALRWGYDFNVKVLTLKAS